MSGVDPIATEITRLLAQRGPRGRDAAAEVEAFLRKGGNITRCPPAFGDAWLPPLDAGRGVPRWKPWRPL